MSAKTVHIPLLRDSHTHPLIYAAFMHGIDLGREAPDSREEALHLIQEHAQTGESGWTIAYGWNNARMHLAAGDFEKLPPVVVFNLSLHGLLVNSAGLALLQRQAPTIGANIHDQTWVEQNLLSVLNAFARDSVTPPRLQQFYKRLLEENGIWHAEEMLLVDAWELELFKQAGLTNRTRFWAAPELYESLSTAEQREVHGIKLFTDGAVGTWTAALYEPYTGTAQAGMLIYDPDTLEAILRRYIGRTAIAVHAIGDRATDQIVAALEVAGAGEAAADGGNGGAEVRIEHAQFISPDTAARAKRLGLRLCMQPNFTDDSLHYADRLPPGYAARNNPFRMLIDEIGFCPGQDLVLGSDGMPHGFREALRQSLFPPHLGQRLTLDEFAAGYCVSQAPGEIEIMIDRERQQVDGRVRLKEITQQPDVAQSAEVL